MAATPSRKAGAEPPGLPAECPKCAGYGYVIGADDVARPCDCDVLLRRGARGRIDTAGIPERFREKSLSSYKAAKGDRQRAAIVDAARSYATTFGAGEERGLILRGMPGCGKTHIAVAILREVVARGFHGHFANFNDLLSRFREAYGDNASTTEAELLSPLEEADLLVLDDVGAESMKDWGRAQLYLIVNRRYERARATIITTNYNEDEFERHVGLRTSSRLYEMCSMDFPPFPDQDWRKANLR